MSNLDDLIREAKEFWQGVADVNGWDMGGRGVTVWVDFEDDDGNYEMLDSIYESILQVNSHLIWPDGSWRAVKPEESADV